MGFIKKWGKIIIAVVVFGGILSLVARIPMARSIGVPTSMPSKLPASTESPTLTTTPDTTFENTPEPTKFSTAVPTLIPTSEPVQTQPPRVPVSPPHPTFLPISSPTPPLSTPEPPPKTLPPVSQSQEASTMPSEETQEPPIMFPEEETQDMTQAAQENACVSGHDFHTSVWETATCLKGGYYNNVCGRCGLVESVTEDPLPHDVEDILVQEGNCMQDTVIRHICKNCGQQVESDTRYTPEVHKWVCAVIDDKEVFYCEWCGVVQ